MENIQEDPFLSGGLYYLDTIQYCFLDKQMVTDIYSCTMDCNVCSAFKHVIVILEAIQNLLSKV